MEVHDKSADKRSAKKTEIRVFLDGDLVDYLDSVKSDHRLQNRAATLSFLLQALKRKAKHAAKMRQRRASAVHM